MRAFSLLILFICYSSMAQTIGNGDGVRTDAQVGIVIEEVPIQGTPYVNEQYQKGMTYINEKSNREALMRYDAYHEAIELIDENGTPRKLLRRENIKAAFDNTIYEVCEYVENGKIKHSYFNALNQGSTILYIRPKKIFIQAQKPEHGYEAYQPPIYKDASSYYIKIGKGYAKETVLSKRAILNVFGSYKKQLKEYARSNNLNLSNEDDVIRLLNFYNTLEKKIEIKQPNS